MLTNTLKAMVFTVGGVEQPIVVSMNHYKPQFAWFLCSQQSLLTYPKILEKLEFEYKKENMKVSITENPDDLMVCFKVAEEIFLKLFEQGFSRDEILVDYTGGSKNMTAAIALASARFGLNYVYVGGSERTKDGLGIVKDGKEVLMPSLNPWVFFAVEEKRKIAQLVNNYQYSAASLLIDEILPKIDDKYRLLYSHLRDIITGFDLWDHFKYEKAVQVLNSHKLQIFRELSETHREEVFLSFAKACEKPVRKLEKICNSIDKNKKMSGKKDKTSQSDQTDNFVQFKQTDIVFDILSNAERRARQGWFDGAVLRLYRALEMVGQVELVKYDIDDSNVDLNKPKLSPEAIQWLQTTCAGKKKMELALENKFQLLMIMGEKKGVEYMSREKEFRNILSQRNLSFLAHGFQVMTEDGYRKFREVLYNFIDKNTGKALTQFPEIGY